MRLAIAIVIAFCAAGAAVGQQGAPPAFRTTTHLIVQTVIVNDAKGQPIPGLAATDFAVTEDGAPQRIAFVEYQALDASPLSALTVTAAPMAAPTASTTLAPPTRAGVVVPPAGDVRYRGRRLMVLYFDLYNMGFFDEIRMYAQAERYVRTRMTAADMIAVMVFQQSTVRLTLDFTEDRAALIGAIQALATAAEDRQNGRTETFEVGGAFGQDNDSFNIFSTDRQLSALQTAVTDLGPLPQMKTLIYLGSGLRLNGADNQAQLRATVNAAVRANVTVNPIDTRGLVASAPLGDATEPSRGGIGMFNGAIAQAGVTRQQRSQDTYYALARDTGGVATFDDNDLSAGIERAAQAVAGYYIIGYYSSRGDRDGKFRRVSIALTRSRSADLAYRAGYFGEKTFSAFNRADKERQLEEALRLDDPITEIPMAIEVNYFQLNRAEYFVPISVRMPGSELARPRPKGATAAEIDMIGEIKDEFGVTHRNMRDRVELKLEAATAAQLAAGTIQYETGFTLLPGRYVIKLLARDATTGRIGTFISSFVIPNLERETARLPISTVVLSSQRQPFADALHTIAQKIAGDTANPLVHDGQKLIPSVTRVFSTSRPLQVFLQAYERDADAMRPLVVFVTFSRDGETSVDAAATLITSGMDPTSKAIPIRMTVPLSGLAPGTYDCQVTVLEPNGAKAAFWRASVTLTR